MVQLHAINAGLTPPRPTTDVDMVLHIETDRITWLSAKAALRASGFTLRQSNNRKSPEHRFERADDIVDVLIADHVAPTALRMRASSHNLMPIPGGTSALRKTVNCRIIPDSGDPIVLSVPNVLGALTLKGGAFLEDSRDRGRHLEDAVVLLATVDDVDEVVEDSGSWTQSDAKRIRVLRQNLPAKHDAWGILRDARTRRRAQRALDILAQGPVGDTN